MMYPVSYTVYNFRKTPRVRAARSYPDSRPYGGGGVEASIESTSQILL